MHDKTSDDQTAAADVNKHAGRPRPPAPTPSDAPTREARVYTINTVRTRLQHYDSDTVHEYGVKMKNELNEQIEQRDTLAT